MKKTPKKKAPAGKSRRARARGVTLRIPISESRATAQDVEKAIADKLATQPTNLFRDTRKVIIVIEKFGGRPE
jgi:hypothetical protein